MKASQQIWKEERKGGRMRGRDIGKGEREDERKERWILSNYDIRNTMASLKVCLGEV